MMISYEKKILDKLKKMLTDEMRDLSSTDKQSLKASTKKSNTVQNESFKIDLDDHLNETKNQAMRLERIFRKLMI